MQERSDRMEVRVDQEKCIACGLCVSSVPAVFRLNDDGKAETAAQPTAKDTDAVREAASACPVDAILVE